MIITRCNIPSGAMACDRCNSVVLPVLVALVHLGGTSAKIPAGEIYVADIGPLKYPVI